MMISSASWEQGDVILSTSQYHQGRREVIVAAITGIVQRLLKV
jgi:hypothetical protein